VGSIVRWIKLFCFSFFLHSFLPAHQLEAQTINVRIFSQYDLKTLVFTPVYGSYFLTCNNDTIKKIKKLDIINVYASSDSLIAKQWVTYLCSCDTIKLISNTQGSYLRIKTIKPDLKVRYYEGNFTIWLDSISHNIVLVNSLDIEKYVSGVIESEVGSNSSLPMEYLKAQAVISRTYALKNKNMYSEEGYDLCDNINCQAYYGKSLRNKNAVLAVNQTRGLVLVDTAFNLIYSVFHSNSGGETASSYQVWNDTIPYLSSVTDSFSIGGKNYLWNFKIKKSVWIDYLKQKGFTLKKRFNYSHKMNHRQKYLIFGNDSIKATDIRKDWGLKSAFFDIIDDGNYIIFNGRGFGHGVGLCQEGALRMAKYGFNFREILEYYYTGVRIVPYSDVMKVKSTEINN
jgi:stage II sporulation protein D